MIDADRSQIKKVLRGAPGKAPPREVPAKDETSPFADLVDAPARPGKGARGSTNRGWYRGWVVLAGVSLLLSALVGMWASGGFKVETKEARTPAPVGIELVRRIPNIAAGDLFYYTAVSRGGKYALVTKDTGRGVWVEVFNVRTGERVFTDWGYQAEFIAGGDQVVVVYGDPARFRIYELPSGKMVRESQPLRPYSGMLVAPGGRHLLYWFNRGFALYDLVGMKEVHAWEVKDFAGGHSLVHFSADGTRLVLRLRDGEPHLVWDVVNNRPTDELKGLVAEKALLGLFEDGKTALAVRDGKVVRVNLTDGKAVEVLRDASAPGAQHNVWSVRTHSCLILAAEGRLSYHRLPIESGPVVEYQLPLDDRAPNRNTYDHASVSLSEDDQYATVVTPRSLYVFRLPDMFVAKKPD